MFIVGGRCRSSRLARANKYNYVPAKCMSAAANMCLQLAANVHFAETTFTAAKTGGSFSFTFTYPLTAGVVGAPQMTSQPVSSILSLFSTALWDLANSRPVHSLLSCHLFFCLTCLLLLLNVPCKMVLARPGERETCPYHECLPLFTMVRMSS